MLDFEIIDRDQIWDSLRAGRKVYAAVFQSARFCEDIHDLRQCTLAEIDLFYKEVNTIFVVMKEENNGN